MFIGLNNTFFNNLYTKENGKNIILNIFLNMSFINVIIFTFIFIMYELRNIIYTIIPINAPKNINNLISPLLNANVEYKNIKPRQYPKQYVFYICYYIYCIKGFS